MGKIVTFYSYKGGVGRSMALANTAMLLSSRGLKVLGVDWDLEAPGLDRYFSDFEIKVPEENTGLLDLLIESFESGRDGDRPNWRGYTSRVLDENGKTLLTLMRSGRDDQEYDARVLGFDWQAYFEDRDGGAFIESLRDEWLDEFDVTLIDSRTGITDSGGVCTIQLPDVLVLVFTANEQSLSGVKNVALRAQRARQKLAYDRMPLLIYPLPSRFDSRTEFEESRKWLERFDEEMKPFYAEWLPSPHEPLQLLEKTKIPYVAFFSFGEKLPVITHGTSDPESLGHAYDVTARLIADDFQSATQIIGGVKPPMKEPRTPRPRVTAPVRSSADDYRHDVYVSYAYSRLLMPWVSEFVGRFSFYMEQILGAEPRLFFSKELSQGSTYPEALQEALRESRVLLPLLSPSYFQSVWCLAEWETFRGRGFQTGTDLIIPVVLSGARAMPPEAHKLESLDLSEYVSTIPAFWKTERAVELEGEIRSLAEGTLHLIKQAPGFDPDFPVVSPEDVDLDSPPLQAFPKI